MDYEKEQALLESARLEAMNEFFKYRPWFERTSGTHNCTERLFEAAFRRGWDNSKQVKGD